MEKNENEELLEQKPSSDSAGRYAENCKRAGKRRPDASENRKSPMEIYTTGLAGINIWPSPLVHSL